MKKQTWILGAVVSLGIALIASLPRLMRVENLDAAFIIASIAYNFFFCMSCWVAYQYIFNKTNWLTLSKRRLLNTILIIGSIGCLAFCVELFLPSFGNKPLQFPEISGNKRLFILFLRGSVVSGLNYFIAYYMYVLAEKQKSLLEIERLKQAQLSANVSSLKEQLSPHFLFNTLNTLSSLTQEKAVKDYVSELANVYRYVLQYNQRDIATLQEELAFIESYLYIIKTRLEDAIDITIQVDESILQSKIPPLTLQLLIENAVKHNIAAASRRLHIAIIGTATFVTISNNLQPKASVTFSTGIGLDNVLQRYRLLFGKEIHIEKTDTAFTVKLPVVC